MSTRAWVVFSGQADLFWLKILRKGFRHCAVVLHDGEHWINIDPLSHVMAVHVSSVPASCDVPLLLEQQGHRVLAVEMQCEGTPAPWGFLTCVGVVKRVLGIRARFIWTPWQLYRYLVQTQTCKGETHLWEV